ncbi:MAG TPA: hypothetical protein PLS66_13055 [Tepiditoga sp.]|nr:hypothetical protein [Tepiditoga sp.]
MLKRKNFYKLFNFNRNSDFQEILESEPVLGEKVTSFYSGIKDFDFNSAKMEFVKNENSQFINIIINV